MTIRVFEGADHCMYVSRTGGMKAMHRSALLPADEKPFVSGYLELLTE